MEPLFLKLAELLIQIPIFPWLVLVHVVNVSLKVAQLPGHNELYWLKSLVLSFMVAFGGSTIAHVLSGKPVPWVFSPNDRLILITFVGWWITNHMLFFQIISRWRIVKATIAAFAAVVKTRSIIQFIDQSQKWFSAGFIGTVVLGTISGSGGSLFLTMERKWRLGPGFLSELSKPTSNLKTAFYISLIYTITSWKTCRWDNYIIMQWDHLITSDGVYKILCMMMFLFAWIEEFSNYPVPLFYPVECFFSSLFRIPMFISKQTNSSVAATIHSQASSTDAVKTKSGLSFVKKNSPSRNIK
eukprot:jgi/Galph1/381/GphlegSOOS_G5086.1